MIKSGAAFLQAHSCALKTHSLSLRLTNAERRSASNTLAILSLAILFLVNVPAQVAAQDEMKVTITDALGRPLSGIGLELRAQDGRTIAHGYTHQDGKAKLPIAATGLYALIATNAHFKPASKLIAWPSSGASFSLIMEAREALNLPVSSSRLRPQNGLSATGNSKYTMTAKDIANLSAGEAAPFNDVLLQMPGVALDQNQEIHIRGEHAGIQYQMNGILLPLDINNDPTFTQLLNAYFVSSVSLIDGILPAQYGIARRA